MNRQQAKEILSAYRPGSEDERDPVFAEALRLTERDPELAAWFNERQAFDAAVSRRLETIPLPAEVLGAIRAGVSRRQSAARRGRTVLLALAACLVLALGLAGIWWHRENQTPTSQFAACRRDMVEFLKRIPSLDLETASLADARRWLHNTRHLRQVQIPARLQRFPTIGCRTLDWHGQKLALVCFMVDGEVVHFIVIPRSGIPDGPPNSAPEFARVEGTTTAAWSQGDFTYLLLSRASEDFLRARL